MGRTALWKKRGLAPMEIIKVYEASQNLKEAATDLEVCEKTLRNWLDSFGYVRKRGFPKGQHKRDTSCVAEWLRAHPETPIPWNMREAAELTGCTESAVSSYLYRKHEDRRERLRKLGDLRKFEGSLQSGDVSIPISSIASVRIYTSPHSSRIKLIGVLSDNRKFSMITTVGYLESLRSTDTG